MDCTESTHLYLKPGQHNDPSLLDAAKTMCLRIVELVQNPNISSIDDFFNGFCCTNNHLTKFCRDFSVNQHLNVNISCTPDAPSSLSDYDTYTFIVLAIFLPLGIAANLLILYAILRYRNLPKQTGYFLCSLAVGDIGVIIQLVGFLIYHNNNANIQPRVHKFLLPSLEMLFAAVSLLQISVISIERALAVTRPLLYPKILTPRGAKRLTVFVWVLGGMHSVLSLLRIPIKANGYETFIFYLSFITLLVLPIVVVISSYTIVMFTAYSHLGEERKRSKMAVTLLQGTLLKEQMQRNSRRSENLIRKKEIKISANIALIVIPFLCCWGFFTFVHIYEMLSAYRFNGVANWFFTVLPLMVSSTNPIVYLFLTRSLRKTVQKIIKSKLHLRTKVTGSILSSDKSPSKGRAKSDERFV